MLRVCDVDKLSLILDGDLVVTVDAWALWGRLPVAVDVVSGERDYRASLRLCETQDGGLLWDVWHGGRRQRPLHAAFLRRANLGLGDGDKRDWEWAKVEVPCNMPLNKFILVDGTSSEVKAFPLLHETDTRSELYKISTEEPTSQQLPHNLVAYVRSQCSDFLIPFFPLPCVNDDFDSEDSNGGNLQEDFPAITYRIIDFTKLQARLQETSGIRRRKQRKHRSIHSKQASEGSTATLLVLLSELFNEVEQEYSTKDCPRKRKRLA